MRKSLECVFLSAIRAAITWSCRLLRTHLGLKASCQVGIIARVKTVRRSAIILMLVCSSVGAAARKDVFPPTTEQPSITSPQDRKTALYERSYALVIANSEYRHWNRLPFVLQEADSIVAALRSNGFTVIRVADASGIELRTEINEFFQHYGRLSKRSRIVLYYSGHGHLDDETDEGYIVPVDAELPGQSSNLLVRSISMEDVRNAAMRMTAIHGLFVFDNCYSGMVFKSSGVAPRPVPRQNSVVDRWRVFQRAADERGRQFIAASGSREIVPSRSPVAAAFVHGLQGSASAAQDGYFTAAELALFVQTQATTRLQRPSYLPLGGAVGDMVFQPGMVADTSAPAASTAAAQVGRERPASASVDTLSGAEIALAWPAVGRIDTTFQMNGRGILIAGARGRAIRASANGRVVYAGSGLNKYGNVVIIKHDKSLLSVYAHNDKLLVKEDQEVASGEVIALMGDSGSDRVGLHFEVRKEGKAVDPMGYLVRVGAAKPGEKVTLSEHFEFASNVATLDRQQKAKAEKLVYSLLTRRVELEVVIVVGFVGDNEKGGVALGRRRAEAIKAELAELGIEKNRIVTEGKAKDSSVTHSAVLEVVGVAGRQK